MRRPVISIVIALSPNLIDIKVEPGSRNRIRVSRNSPVKSSGVQLCDLKIHPCNVEQIWVSEEVAFDGLMTQFDAHDSALKLIHKRRILATERVP